MIENLINLGRKHNVLDSDAIKYFPIILLEEQSAIYTDYNSSLKNMAKKDHGNSQGDYIYGNNVRNDDLFGASIYKDLPLVDKIKSLKSEIINEIDFKQYHANVDGDMAVCVLSSYLASLNIYLHILKSPDRKALNINNEAKGKHGNKEKVFCYVPGDTLKNGVSNFVKDGMSYLAKKAETRKHIFIFLKDSHYQAIIPREKLKKQLAKGKITQIEIDQKLDIIINNAGDSNCLFHSVADVLKYNKIDKTVDGDLLNNRTKEYLNANFERLFNGLYVQIEVEESQNSVYGISASSHFRKLSTLMSQYKAAVESSRRV
ncbi:hypothetical protein [Citrobacter sp. Igbk 16]|uniref:hypothetical protein n=1 Tax=Citrobacter sp. Igbk 16 TaxID=2963958 RepID=UPI002303FD68|nr:hypothetical protein [Citrobacter sp. Igbk 16]MDA8517389.1 hypothetical protein [Citrobacter sp. Igbk 16]